MGIFVAEQKLVGGRLLRDNRVLFISDVRDEMGGNFECVYEALCRENEAAAKGGASARGSQGRKWGIDMFLKDKQLHRETVKDARTVARKLRSAKYIFLEDVYNYLQFYTPLPGQEIIQLWHAEGAYKKFGFSRKEEDIKISPGHRKYTKAIVSAEPIRGCYAEGYGISVDKVIATGIPRSGPVRPPARASSAAFAAASAPSSSNVRYAPIRGFSALTRSITA